MSANHSDCRLTIPLPEPNTARWKENCTHFVYTRTDNVVVRGGREGVREDERVKGDGLTFLHRVGVVNEGAGESSWVAVVKHVGNGWSVSFRVDTQPVPASHHHALLRQKTHHVRLQSHIKIVSSVRFKLPALRYRRIHEGTWLRSTKL